MPPPWVSPTFTWPDAWYTVPTWRGISTKGLISTGLVRHRSVQFPGRHRQTRDRICDPGLGIRTRVNTAPLCPHFIGKRCPLNNGMSVGRRTRSTAGPPGCRAQRCAPGADGWSATIKMRIFRQSRYEKAEVAPLGREGVARPDKGRGGRADRPASSSPASRNRASTAAASSPCARWNAAVCGPGWRQYRARRARFRR